MKTKALTQKELDLINSKLGLRILLNSKKVDLNKTLERIDNEIQLKELQGQLIELQNWVIKNQKKLSSYLKEGMPLEKEGLFGE
mgnify:CR=1 FL=1